MTLLHIVIAALAGGILSTIAAAVTLNVQATWIPGFVSFAVGALLSAVFLELLPQQVGDFAVLLHSGFARGKAFAYNDATGVATLAGALAAYGALADIAAAPAHGARDCRGEPALRGGRRSDTKPAPAPGTGRNGQADALDRTRHRDHRGRALAARTALT